MPSFAYSSTKVAGRPANWQAHARPWGFTLIELMVVVIIIAVVAALTIPNVATRMRERRASEAAQRVALFFQQARMQALGRGTAVLVRYERNPTVPNGKLTFFEGQRGITAGAGCEALPEPSCTALNWNDPGLQQRREITQFNLKTRSEYDRVFVEMYDPNGDKPTALDVCFSPLGRTFARHDLVGAFTPLTGVYQADVYRAEGTTKLGKTTEVMLLPNGTARIGSVRVQ